MGRFSAVALQAPRDQEDPSFADVFKRAAASGLAGLATQLPANLIGAGVNYGVQKDLQERGLQGHADLTDYANQLNAANAAEKQSQEGRSYQRFADVFQEPEKRPPLPAVNTQAPDTTGAASSITPEPKAEQPTFPMTPRQSTLRAPAPTMTPTPAPRPPAAAAGPAPVLSSVKVKGTIPAMFSGAADVAAKGVAPTFDTERRNIEAVLPAAARAQTAGYDTATQATDLAGGALKGWQGILKGSRGQQAPTFEMSKAMQEWQEQNPNEDMSDFRVRKRAIEEKRREWENNPAVQSWQANMGAAKLGLEYATTLTGIYEKSMQGAAHANPLTQSAMHYLNQDWDKAFELTLKYMKAAGTGAELSPDQALKFNQIQDAAAEAARARYKASLESAKVLPGEARLNAETTAKMRLDNDLAEIAAARANIRRSEKVKGIQPPAGLAPKYETAGSRQEDKQAHDAAMRELDRASREAIANRKADASASLQQAKADLEAGKITAQEAMKVIGDITAGPSVKSRALKFLGLPDFYKED